MPDDMDVAGCQVTEQGGYAVRVIFDRVAEIGGRLGIAEPKEVNEHRT